MNVIKLRPKKTMIRTPIELCVDRLHTSKRLHLKIEQIISELIKEVKNERI